MENIALNAPTDDDTLLRQSISQLKSGLQQGAMKSSLLVDNQGLDALLASSFQQTMAVSNAEVRLPDIKQLLAPNNSLEQLLKTTSRPVDSKPADPIEIIDSWRPSGDDGLAKLADLLAWSGGNGGWG